MARAIDDWLRTDKATRRAEVAFERELMHSAIRHVDPVASLSIIVVIS